MQAGPGRASPLSGDDVITQNSAFSFSESSLSDLPMGDEADFGPPMGGKSQLSLPMGDEGDLDPLMGGESHLNLPMGDESFLGPPMGSESHFDPQMGDKSRLDLPMGGESHLFLLSDELDELAAETRRPAEDNMEEDDHREQDNMEEDDHREQDDGDYPNLAPQPILQR